jgi:hypothetical protein
MGDLGTFTFLPWLRRGAASEITRTEGQQVTGPDAARVSVPVSVTLNGSLTRGVPLTLLGPGDVAGLDRDAIIRVFPTPNAFDVESNYFPLVELDQADLPWRYTPARAGTTERLTPWLCLAVLRDDELQSVEEPAQTGTLPALTVNDAAALPPWDQLWAWAHAAISGGADLDAAAIQAVVDAEPHRAVSRLLCARRLEPNTAYTAFLVPTFQRGRLAGLGLPVPDTLDALAPAWGAHGAVRLPIYHRWRFGTGAAGDFEFLVRQLVARRLPSTVGKRDMNVATPGAGLPAAFDRPLGLEGALSALSMERTGWTGQQSDAFRGALAGLLNLPAERLAGPDQDRAVVPPLYGRWHARADRLAPGGPPVWFNALNQDPRERVAAGAGTRVVQEQQRQLMAGAWQQVQGIREANERLRLTQLARELALRLYDRHLARHDADQLLEVSAPVLTRIMASPTTIRARLHASPMLPGMTEGQLRRIARPRGPVGRRQGRVAQARPWSAFSRVNSGALKRPAPLATPPQLLTPRAAPPLVPDAPTPAALERLGRWPRVWRIAAAAAVALAAIAVPAIGVGVALAAAAIAAACVLAARRADALLARARQQAATASRVEALASGTLAPAQLEEAAPPPWFVPAEGEPGVLAREVDPAAATPAGREAAVAAFKTAAGAMLARLGTPVETPAPLVRANLGQLREKIAAGLDPRRTIVAGLGDRLSSPPNVRRPTDDEAEPVMAAPTFPQPMYAPLAALSHQWMLPGLEKVPPNTATVVTTNQRFIEAYMTGLNHEMARELQWNGYPTDMRGTYFQRFWDVAGTAEGASAPPDIEPLHEWDAASELGAHEVRTPPPGGEQLVLLIRGDVFRRYPNTQVYAVKAVLGSDGMHTLGDEPVQPVFSGRLQPDVTFFGFQLTAAEARGEPSPTSAKQGYFFVIQEQPAEPRFGLDIPTAVGGRPEKWSDLSWGHLAIDDAALAQVGYIDLGAALPDTSVVSPMGGAHWHLAEGARASDLAFITLQQPVRVAIHGADMIPAPGEEP